MILAAKQRVAEHAEKKRQAEAEWVAHNYPKAAGPAGGVLTEQLVTGHAVAGEGPMRVRYRGSEIRYVGDVLGRDGPPLTVISFGSGEGGAPIFTDQPAVFTVERGQTKINTGLDSAIAAMASGERRVVIVPASLGYGRAGLYTPEVPGKRRLVISPNAMLVYEVEVLGND